MQKILVILNDITLEDTALRMAQDIGDKNDTAFILLHFLDSSDADGFFVDERRNIPSHETHLAINRFCGLMEDLLVQGFKAVSRLCEGDIVESILNVATNENVGLMVIGYEQLDSQLSFRRGDERKRLLNFAPCPVLTIPEGSVHLTSSLFPVFQLEGALEKYAHAHRLLARKNMCVHVVAYPDRHFSESRESLVKVLSHLEQQLIDDRIEFRSSACITDDVPASLLSLATKERMDLIVLTDSTANGVKDLSFCNYIHHVVGEAKTAILFVNSLTILKRQLGNN